MTPQKQCPYWKRIIFSPNEYQCTRPVPQQQQEYEFICECCKNACRVTMKNAIPPDCGCLVNSDIGAMWVRRSRPAPLTQTQSPNIAKAISELEYSLSADPLEEIDYHIRDAINLLKEVSP